MVLSKEELLNKIKGFIGDNSDDDSLSLIEDVTDTLSDMENSNNEDWKQKYIDNDKMWREKYKQRFFTNGDDDDTDFDDEEDKVLSYDKLFKEV